MRMQCNATISVDTDRSNGIFFSYAAENDQSGKGRRPFSANSLQNSVRGDVVVVISWIPDN